ncbi:auxin-responsive protein SAUR32-like [Phalaenopsis equestris]|uniref:auxin-responsive protein SAUR32-like n=1 Tax=Phalaenopsis equestris TaxID=78828 RepID=UPI0009E54F85|nr:auxin-responsive protein SAUR32-like [Phalaenopsis equestris]XP_020598136.1 auxin-responsive protein SAUR32-like [Phalaenopsis equestris]
MGGGGGGKKGAAPPKGCIAFRVGGKGEEMQRFVVPVEYVNHPLFAGLLKEAEEEYGFEQKGSIRIPCHVEDFRHVQGVIDRENAGHGQLHLHFSRCFKA